MKRSIASWLAVAPLLLLPGASPPSPQDWTPDPVQRTQVIKGRSDGSGGEVRCTFYADLLVQESDTDTPSPADALLIRAGGTRPACNARAPAGVRLKTAGFGLLGRAGPFLLFQESSSHGSVPFVVIDARTRRMVIEDISDAGIDEPGAMRIIKAEPGALTLAFRRGFNASCSIVASPGACWRSIAGDRVAAMPHAIARLAPPVPACARSYRQASAPADNPSVITYSAQVSWTASQGKRVTGSGPVECRPLP
jgi:hypothetical protein